MLRLLVLAIGLSAFGDLAALTALSLEVADRTDSGAALAALYVALWAPAVALGGVAGRTVDRRDARAVLVVATLAQAAVAVALAAGGPLALLLGLTALLGAGNALAQPAEFALVPRVAKAAARAPRASADEGSSAAVDGHVEAARALGFMLGPIAGAVLAAGPGVGVALLVDAATFAFVATAGAVLRAAPAERAAGPALPPRPRDGLDLLLADRGLRLVVLVAAVSLVPMTAVWTAEVFFARDVVGAGALGYGLIMAAWTLGMVLGGVAIARRIAPAAMGAAVLAAIAVQGAGLALPPLWPVLPLALAAAVVGGAGHGVKNTLLRTLIHDRVPAAAHGRAFAAFNGLRNGAELAALGLGALLMTAAGPRWTVFLAGTAPILVVVVATVAARGARRLEPPVLRAPEAASA